MAGCYLEGPPPAPLCGSTLSMTVRIGPIMPPVDAPTDAELASRGTTSVVRKCFQALLPMHHVLDGGQGDLTRPSRPWRPVRPYVHVRQTPTGPDAGKLLQPYHFQPAPEPSAPQTER